MFTLKDLFGSKKEFKETTTQGGAFTYDHTSGKPGEDAYKSLPIGEKPACDLKDMESFKKDE